MDLFDALRKVAAALDPGSQKKIRQDKMQSIGSDDGRGLGYKPYKTKKVKVPNIKTAKK